MRISSSRLIVTAKMPPWAQWMLRKAGVPDEFRMEDLTEDQKRTVCLVANVARLLKEGLVTVQFTDEDEGPRIALTEKGCREAAETAQPP